MNRLFSLSKLGILIVLALSLLLLPACESARAPVVTETPPAETTSDESPGVENKTWSETFAGKLAALEAAPSGEAGPGLAWYHVFVYSFYDSDGDGIGDLRGVMQRLDYIKSMGFDGVWLSPIHPSSTYHKYNVRDYTAIDPEYGSMADFDALIRECDSKGIKVILDLVLNHSDLHHPWFTEHPEYYNISDTPGNGNWEQLPDGSWYECQFWGEMPDLNLDSPELRAEFEEIFAFWLGRGVHGFRLDAVKDYTGNVQNNIEILTWVNGAVKAIKPDAYIVGEVWDTTNALYQYYESGIDSFFSFPFAGSDGAIAKLLLRPDAPIDDYLQQTAAAYLAVKTLNPDATNAPFFTNHDMARAAGFMRRDSNLIKTAWGLSLTQPGDAFVYYGEELGMSGPGKDENKRAPMFWTEKGDEAGMTDGPPGMEEVTHGFPPADAQVGDPDSIFSYVRSAVLLRAKYPHIGRGTFDVIQTGENRAGAAGRIWQDSEINVAWNVSAETVTLTLHGTLADYLSATGEKPVQDGETLTLPGYTIAILVLDYVTK